MTTHFLGECAIPTELGSLRAGIWMPDLAGPLPGIVLVDGSGDGAYDDWGGWPEWIADCGAVVLTHDKPPNWMDQDLHDRARETQAAVGVLRSQPEVAGPVGLFGVSQGAWVAFMVAASDPAGADFVISMSGPGVSVSEQDRYRIETALRSSDLSEAEINEAMAWVDERTQRLLSGEEVEAIIHDQQRFADRAWAPIALQHFDDPAILRFLTRILAFDPVPAISQTRCPVLALFGGADPLVPVARSVEAFASHLPGLDGGKSGLAVFPGAGHGLFTANRIDGVDRTSQLASGLLPMVAGFIEQFRPLELARGGRGPGNERRE